jgi:tetratricopeptide (TPR) repeat protein
MRSRAGQIFCQRCLAANPVEHESCVRCGTRLMLVVEPSSLRYEEETSVAGNYEEHLLERVSSLENRLMRVAERLEQGLELLLRHARTSYFDHVLLETLISALDETKTVDRRKVEETWRERCDRDALSVAETSAREELCLTMAAGYKGGDREAFIGLVREGFACFDKGHTAKGVRLLERAAALAPTNAPLNSFLGEHFFRAGKTALARDYLTRARAAEPEDRRVCLLLGLACGDEGDAQGARELLHETLRRGANSYAAHYALGRLFAAEADWESALSEFRNALAARNCAEAHYVVGLVYFQLQRNRMALRHLVKAVEMSPDYGEAFYLLGLVHLRLGERENAVAAFDSARSLDADEPRYRTARRLVARAGEAPPPPNPFGAARHGRKRLVTGGDDRLAAMLQSDALDT